MLTTLLRVLFQLTSLAGCLRTIVTINSSMDIVWISIEFFGIQIVVYVSFYHTQTETYRHTYRYGCIVWSKIYWIALLSVYRQFDVNSDLEISGHIPNHRGRSSVLAPWVTRLLTWPRPVTLGLRWSTSFMAFSITFALEFFGKSFSIDSSTLFAYSHVKTNAPFRSGPIESESLKVVCTRRLFNYI